MDPPCQAMIYKILPTFRFLMAKQLINKHGYTQTKAARKMGITQSAISQYINLKRATRRKELGANYSLVESMAHEAAAKIAKNEMNPDELTTYFCKLCNALSDTYTI